MLRLDFKIKRFVNNLLKDDQSFAFFLLGVYLTLITISIIKEGVTFGLDTIFIVFLVASLIIGKSSAFIRDWLPFVLMFFSYEAMRGVADNLNQRVHIFEMIRADEFLFGKLPTIFLQNQLWHHGILHWYDIASFLLYLSHFWFIFLAGFVIWLKKKECFRVFSWGFIILCALGFITYLLFPAMAPWDASRREYIGDVNRLLMEIGKKLNLGEALTFVYYWIGPNEVAAFPSLHAGWAWFACLSLVSVFGKKLLPIFIVPLGLAFSLVYLGEHYVIDILAGILYATGVFWFSKKLLNSPRLS